MDVKYINPFITALNNTFEMMLGSLPERDGIYLKDDALTSGDITGVIGFAEKNITGTVSLSFPEATALHLYHLMTGENVFQITRNVQDSIGELANIVAGGAKTILSESGFTFHISIPSVIIGQHKISHKVNTPVIAVPFNLDRRHFVMEVSMKIVEGE
jgi:chemotaxis protein CheX